MMKKEDKKDFLSNVDEDECFLVKVLDKGTKKPVFSFNEGYYRDLPAYPMELINVFVDYVQGLGFEIFHISGNQIMTHEGLFVITEKQHLNTDINDYEFPQ